MEKTFTPKIESAQLNAEKKSELNAVPIFRSNDLYKDLFPEITPLFERGEEPTAKKIFASILENQSKTVILDNTCQRKIFGTFLDEETVNFFIEKGLEDAIAPAGADGKKKQIGRTALCSSLQDKYQITLLNETIDSRIAEITDVFSPASVGSLFEIAKQKNSDIQKVYILSDNISDHVGSFPKDKVLDVLKEKVQSEFGLTAVVVSTLNRDDVKKGDLIVFDRHNHLMDSLVDPMTYQLPKDISLQVSLLPLETELHNNEQFQDRKMGSETLVETLRKNFEKVD